MRAATCRTQRGSFRRPSMASQRDVVLKDSLIEAAGGLSAAFLITCRADTSARPSSLLGVPFAVPVWALPDAERSCQRLRPAGGAPRGTLDSASAEAVPYARSTPFSVFYGIVVVSVMRRAGIPARSRLARPPPQHCLRCNPPDGTWQVCRFSRGSPPLRCREQFAVERPHLAAEPLYRARVLHFHA